MLWNTNCSVILFALVSIVSVARPENTEETSNDSTSMSNDGDSPRKGPLMRDFLLEAGTPLNITCPINKTYTNWSHAIFEEHTRVSNDHVRVYNNNTIGLYFDKTNETNTMYYGKIHVDGKPVIVCVNHVLVGTKPKNVTDFQCVSRNWDQLNCTWTGPQNYVYTNYDLKYTLPGKKQWRYSCPNNKPKKLENSVYHCFWTLKTDPHYRQGYKRWNFTLTANNTFGTNNQTFNFNHYESVLLDKPANLSVTKTTPHSITLVWCVTNSVHMVPGGLEAQIQYQTIYEQRYYNANYWQTNSTGKLPVNNSCFKYLLANLKYANTYYDIRVRIKSVAAHGDKWWSPFVTISTTTPATLPTRPPRVNRNAFEVFTSSNTRDVFVYWQEIEQYEQNGDDFRYSVIAHELNTQRTITPDSISNSMAILNNMSHRAYKIVILSTNHIGNSTQSTELIIPKQAEILSETIGLTKRAVNDHKYFLAWHLNAHAYNYTLFWCQSNRDRPYPCRGKLNWLEFDSHVTNFTKTVDSVGVYQFGVAYHSLTSSSGITWATCTLVNGRKVGKLHNVWIGRIEPTSLVLKWRLECADSDGMVNGVKVYYCPLVATNGAETCAEPEQTLTLSMDNVNLKVTNTINITGLVPFTNYSFAVAVLTKVGEGPRSIPLRNATSESAPTPVEITNVSNVTNSSFAITWKKPLVMNGVLRRYELHVNGNKSVIKNDENTLQLGQLLPFTVYNVSISACTSHCSSRSHANLIQTKRGVPSKIDHVAVNFVNDTMITLDWKPPVIAGGPDMEYDVKIETEIQNKVEYNYIYNYTSTKLSSFHKNCDNKCGIKWFVRAVVYSETGERLVADWSAPVLREVAQPNNSTVYFVTIVLILTILCGLGVTLSKFLWSNWNAMKNIEVKLPPGLVAHVNKDQKANIQINVPLSQVKDARCIAEKTRGDEQRLLKKQTSGLSDTKVRDNASVSSNCSMESGDFFNIEYIKCDDEYLKSPEVVCATDDSLIIPYGTWSAKPINTDENTVAKPYVPIGNLQQMLASNNATNDESEEQFDETCEDLSNFMIEDDETFEILAKNLSLTITPDDGVILPKNTLANSGTPSPTSNYVTVSNLANFNVDVSSKMGANLNGPRNTGSGTAGTGSSGSYFQVFGWTKAPNDNCSAESNVPKGGQGHYVPFSQLEKGTKGSKGD